MLVAFCSAMGPPLYRGGSRAARLRRAFQSRVPSGYPGRMADAPVTPEGWYVLHEVYAVAWTRLGALPAGERDAVVAEASALLEAQARPAEGHSAFASVLSQKGDLCVMHWRKDLEGLRREEVAL